MIAACKLEYLDQDAKPIFWVLYQFPSSLDRDEFKRKLDALHNPPGQPVQVQDLGGEEGGEVQENLEEGRTCESNH